MGTVHCIKALLPRMKARKDGRIVITASQAALVGIYGLSVYSSTKFALRGLAESLRMEVINTVKISSSVRSRRRPVLMVILNIVSIHFI